MTHLINFFDKGAHVVYGMGQELLFWKLKNLNKLLVFEALYP